MSRDLVIKVGEYKNRDGETKGEYKKLGVILSGDNGPYALLDPTVDLGGCLVKQRLMNPDKSGNAVMCSIFDREGKNKKQDSHGEDAAPQDNSGDSDLPF